MSRHGAGVIPKTVLKREVSSLELVGRCAGSGYSAVVMGINRGETVPDIFCVSSSMACANLYQVIAPVAVR